ncbi:alpha-1,4 glucan phosphorylase [Virgisporangium aurantiacum]|uniref:Alpha-1,4 glucan phosphorylase n=1 Tax=Virgisporangium aurantiacum TaxID=175570 RepID=A0A8J4DZY8_9ACTN|nr:alpha-1,4 glucan phosphorylase [Virgisporangium aurantiacum]
MSGKLPEGYDNTRRVHGEGARPDTEADSLAFVPEIKPGPNIRRVGTTVEDFEQNLLSNLYFQRGTTIESASAGDAYHTLAVTLRDRLVDRYARTVAAHYETNPRFVYYLSAEYMLGRQLNQNLLYTGTEQWTREIAEARGLSMETLATLDVEPGLGNGGLGRLAACLLDSMATLDIPAVGYGIRYDYGIFKQTFQNGEQVERPDDWTFYGNPWEFAAPDDQHVVGFYGKTESANGDSMAGPRRWIPSETVRGEPSHMLVPGYGTQTVNIVRLWRARASRQSFDLARFGAGQYGEAVQHIALSESISKVLYPDDSTELGRELRLKQQYFLVSCSLRDIIRRFQFRNRDWDAFPDKVVIQLNDTHPVLAIPELMRLLVDEHQVDWDRAWSITQRTFAYTCHTLLPEALETWPVALMERLLPRHMEIIYLINHVFLRDLDMRHPGDLRLMRDLSLIQEEPERRVRMANLAVVGSHAVNGVAELHSRLLAETTLRDFASLWPEKFHNVTNGVTPRRFVRLANPRLSSLISAHLGGDGWLTDLDQLAGLEAFADDNAMRERWRDVKRLNKVDLAAYAARTTGVVLDPQAMCDVMIKRFHEYKRQLLKVLHVVTLYNRLRDDPAATVVPRTVVFAGKAAPGYRAAKLVMKLVNAVADTVNNDPRVAGALRVVFLPDYNVTRAELIVPSADLSEQISLAGKEASGTGNMKLALNGAVTIGTLDGANIEIRDRVGADNFFLFGYNAEQAMSARRSGYSARSFYDQDPELRAVLDAISGGVFSSGDRDAFASVVDSVLGWDEYLCLGDYRSYVDCQDTVERAWQDRERWTSMSIRNTARSGFFSSDRTVRDYCRGIWNVEPVRVPEE